MAVLPEPGPLVIVGAGGFGRECLDVVEALNAAGGDVTFAGFLDDGDVDEPLLAARAAPFLGPSEADVPIGCRVVIGIGDGAVRQLLDTRMTDRGLTALSIHHPLSSHGAAVTVGPGAVLCAGARLTTNIRLGRHVHLNLNVTVGHDAVLGDYVTVFPGATISGNVTIGDRVTIGTGANILPGVELGAGSVVGAGAVVVGDVPVDTTVVGMPARPVGARARAQDDE